MNTTERGKRVLDALDAQTRDRLLDLDPEGRQSLIEAIRRPLTLERDPNGFEGPVRASVVALADYLESGAGDE